MNRFLLAAAILIASGAGALADVMVDPMLSGTGDNVVFDSISGHVVLGSLNGMHNNIVDFTDLKIDGSSIVRINSEPGVAWRYASCCHPSTVFHPPSALPASPSMPCARPV